MNVGVVGCGYWGSKHVRVLQSIGEVEQIVAVDLSEARLSALKRSFPALAVASSLESVLDQIDAAIIATSPRAHAQLASLAISAGKSVLVEKPMATSSADGTRLIDEASEAGVTLMVGHTFEYNAAVWMLRELMQGDELGNIYYLDSARLNLGLYQSNVNVIWDLAPHDVSICNYLLGSSPASVEAWASKHAHRYLEDVAYLRLSYPDVGVTANIHVSWLDPCKVRRVTVVGSGKMAVYNDLAAEERVRIFDKGVVPPADESSLPEIPMSYRYGEIRSPYVPFEEPLSVQDRHFITCILDGDVPQTNGLNGLAVVRVLEAAQMSLQVLGPVALDGVSGVEPELAEVS